jgi:hypothetical protein
MAKDIQDILNSVLLRPESCFNGDGLAPEVHSVIDPRDRWFVEIIGHLEYPDLVTIGNSFKPLDMGHYFKEQKKWFECERDLIAKRPERNGARPTDLELIKDSEKYRNMERFRLAYVVQYPHKVALNMTFYARSRYETDLFIAIISKIHRIPFPYFELIASNTFLNQNNPS